MIHRISIFLLLIFALFSCKPSQQSSSSTKAEPIQITFLHINDVYEIAGVSGGKYGNLARVAQLKQDLMKENPNTYLVLSGDFLNPSVLGTLKLDGKAIKGKQMIETMNAAGVDFVTFGNHEFDLKEDEVLERINESDFEWIASNTFYFEDGKIQPFTRKGQALPTYITISPKNKLGNEVKVGIIGITTSYNQTPYVRYTDEFETAKNVYRAISKDADFVIALTHLLENEDEKLAGIVPQLKLLMGGHDHENMKFDYDGVIMAKADANARTAYIHRLTYYPDTKKLNIDSELKLIDSSIGYEPKTEAVIEKWNDIADSVFTAQGFETDRKIYQTKETLEAREVKIRNEQTNAGRLVVDAIAEAFPKADLAVLGSGSIRIDDQMSGVITEYDVLRMLPFGGKIYQFEIKGDLLTRFLDAGMQNKGAGGYLQYQSHLTHDKAQGWLLDGKRLKDNKTYKIATNDYILTGKENNMSFMNAKENKDIKKLKSSDDMKDPRSDIRKAVIAYLIKKKR